MELRDKSSQVISEQSMKLIRNITLSQDSSIDSKIKEIALKLSQKNQSIQRRTQQTLPLQAETGNQEIKKKIARKLLETKRQVLLIANMEEQFQQECRHLIAKHFQSLEQRLTTSTQS